MSKLITKIAQYSGYEYNQVLTIALRSPGFYKMYKVKKRNGGERLIFHPSKETKILQYAIIDLFLKFIPISENAYAYRTGLKSPLKNHALQHAHNCYLLHIDFKDFFPSIKPSDLWRAIHQFDSKIDFDIWDKNVFDKSLFLNHNGKVFLSIGAPASPIISNIVMKELDDKILGICKRFDECSVYTRYADDIYISSKNKGMCSKIYEQIFELINTTESPKLTINKDKTKFASKKGKRVITGLCVTNKGDIVIPRDKKKEIKSKLYLYTKNQKVETKEKQRLKGYLAFIKDVEPDFYNRLVLKYGDVITLL
jgi:Reverse transcriptase (RNA-dependent DNA polymerase).